MRHQSIRQRRVTWRGLEIPIEPIDPAFKTVLLKAGTPDAVMLIRVYNQLGLEAKAFHGNIHLLGVVNWHIPVHFSTHPQGRSREALDFIEM